MVCVAVVDVEDFGLVIRAGVLMKVLLFGSGTVILARKSDDCNKIGTKGSKKCKKFAVKRTCRDTQTPDKTLYAMKYAHREYVHGIRSFEKELCGRSSSLRYFKWACRDTASV